VLLAGLGRYLGATAAADAEADRPWLRVPDRGVTGASFAAARHGLAAVVVSPLTGRPTAARRVLDELMSVLAPAAEAGGDGSLIRDLLTERIRQGSGAERQLALWRAGPRQAFVQALANVSAGLDSASA
jgi:carboxylate-amine ligase